MASLPLPPRVVRRVVLGPLVGVASAAVVVLTPVLVVLAVPIDLLVAGRRWRTVRVVAFGFVYCLYEVACLGAVLWMWLASGFGAHLRTARWQDDHYRLMAWWLRGLRASGTRLFRLGVKVETEAERRDGPVLVFSRHGGAGNSLMLVATIMLEYRRRPRIIMLEKLQWEPLFDTILHRLPNRFIKHGAASREAQIAAIGELASGLGDKDALVLFPEGHDFNPRLRERAIAHLRKKGHDDSARKAEQMPNVLPPRIGGVTTAIEHAPGADVIFVAHTAFEDVGSLADLWRRIPLDTAVAARYWRIPAAEVPTGGDELVEWLFAWWARIDTWIGEKLGALQLTAEAPPPETEDPPAAG